MRGVWWQADDFPVCIPCCLQERHGRVRNVTLDVSMRFCHALMLTVTETHSSLARGDARLQHLEEVLFRKLRSHASALIRKVKRAPAE